MTDVFYTSPWVPAEWIKAHGLQPRGVWAAPDFGAEALPLSAGVCAFSQAVVRLAQKQTDSAVIFTTHCDQLRRGFDEAAGASSKRVFLFNLPATWQTPTALRILSSEFQRLGHFLTAAGGHPPPVEDLADLMIQYGAARRQLREASRRLPARAYAEAVAQFHWEGPKRGCFSRSRVDDPEVPCEPPGNRSPASAAAETAEPRSASIPLALIGGPLPPSHGKLFDIVARAGGCVVLNATDSGERGLLPTAEDEMGAPGAARALTSSLLKSSPAELLARRYLDGCVDVFQRPNTRLYSWLRERLAARNVRGIMLWHFVGCDLWRAEAQSLREAFGLPLLLLEADEAHGNAPRQTGRIEAFLEALR